MSNATKVQSKSDKTNKSEKGKSVTKGKGKEAPAPVQEKEKTPRVYSNQNGRDFAGNRPGTRAHAINAVLLRHHFAGTLAKMTAGLIGNEANASNEGKAYTEATGKPVGAVSNHLLALTLSGHLQRNEKGELELCSPFLPEAPKAERKNKKNGKGK